ncbi:MAG: hypothetical protein U0S12_15715 [Fimbriimonadales bacterium]
MLTTVAILAGQANVFQGWSNNKAIPCCLEEPTSSISAYLAVRNAEAYWNLKGDMIEPFQSRQPGFPDEQIFNMKADGSGKRLAPAPASADAPVATWTRTASTFTSAARTPRIPARRSRSTCPRATFDGQPELHPVPREPGRVGRHALISKPGYVAEATAFELAAWPTSTGRPRRGRYRIIRLQVDVDGNLDIKVLTQVTTTRAVWWSYDSEDQRRRCRDRRSPYVDRLLHKENLVRPSKLEIWIMDATASEQAATNLNCASFAPFLHPNGKTIIFCSNYGDPKGREFNLFTINVDGTNLQQITKSPEFDGFPMWTRDGKHLVFASNRNGSVRGETNVFVADWKD